ncbi:hypothetical protein B5F98_00105 [Pseudoflavonifractor sp. An44]|uniref:excisionase n=1 Tax=Pseudoflavonifractor sp. An44 TaxID=1965635 RepID=UPI000B39401D|nr:excisionase [Pseudoflavonifractor sp. An44]OUN99621.1 hypothetical protein B5F98_00105 [Pseudoflavonifractor sp. An44]
MNYKEKLALVPIWKKCLLTLDEAAAYSGMGRGRLMKLSDQDDCEFVVWNGYKRLFKRKKLEEFIEQMGDLEKKGG